MELPQTIENFVEISDQLDRDTFRSSKLEPGNPQYERIKSLGTEVLPLVIGQLSEGKPLRWRAQLVNEIAHTTLMRAIDFDPALRTQPDYVRKRILEWWETVGQAAYNSLGD